MNSTGPFVNHNSLMMLFLMPAGTKEELVSPVHLGLAVVSVYVAVLDGKLYVGLSI